MQMEDIPIHPIPQSSIMSRLIHDLILVKSLGSIRYCVLPDDAHKILFFAVMSFSASEIKKKKAN